MKVTVDVDSKQFTNCNMFYLKKFFGLKEILLISFLAISAILMWVFFHNILIFICLAIFLVIFLGALLFYYFTVKKGYKTEYIQRGAKGYTLTFRENDFLIEIKEKERTYEDHFDYKSIDRISITPDRIYIFATLALNYYVTKDSVIEGSDYASLCAYLTEKVPTSAFKMKQKKVRRSYINGQN